MGFSAIAAVIADVVASVSTAAATVVGAGIAADAIGAAVTYGAVGGVVGGAIGGITNVAQGGSFLKGAVTGAETGALIGAGSGAGSSIGLATGFGATAGGAVGGAAGGASGAAATGGNPLTGALEGAGASLAGSALGGASSGDSVATTGEGGTPTIAGSPGSAGAAGTTGSFSTPSSVDALGSSDINSALSSNSLSGQSLSQPTALGSESSGTGSTVGGDIGGGGGDTSNLGPINSTPTISPDSGGAGVNPTPGSTTGGGITPDQSLQVGGQSSPLATDGNSTSNYLTQSTNVSGTSPTSTTADATPTTDPGFFSNIANGNFGGAASNVGDFLTNTKNLPTILQGGYAAFEALEGPPGLTDTEKQLRAQGQEFSAAATSGLNQANSGQLTAPQAASVATYVQNQTNALYQQLASSGVADPSKDSRFLAGQAQIQQQAQALTQQYIQQTFSQAMSAAGVASQDLGNVANAQNSADNNYTSAISNAIGAIGGFYAQNGSKKAA